jgi:hypothetical protein
MKPSFKPRRSIVLRAVRLFALVLTSAAAADSESTQSPKTTPQSLRAAEHQSAYEALPAADRQHLLAGNIARGHGMKLVYIALGRPDVVTTTADARTIRWTYRNFVPPFTNAQKPVAREKRLAHVNHTSPLHDTFEAWRHGMQKHDIILPLTEDEYNVGAVGNRAARPLEAVQKSPGQSWSEYATYRRAADDARESQGQAMTDMLRAKAQHDQKEMVKEIQRIGPLSAPEPVTVEVIFRDQAVSDAIVNQSVSAFSR